MALKQGTEAPEPERQEQVVGGVSEPPVVEQEQALVEPESVELESGMQQEVKVAEEEPPIPVARESKLGLLFYGLVSILWLLDSTKGWRLIQKGLPRLKMRRLTK